MKKKKYIKKSIKLISSIVDIPKDLKIYIKFDQCMKINSNVLGTYSCNTNIICLNPLIFQLDDKTIYKTIYHEIGHCIHYHFFHYKAQYIPRKYQGDPHYYCNSNQKESFAECFADYIYAKKKHKDKKIKNNKRLNKMNSILESIKETE